MCICVYVDFACLAFRAARLHVWALDVIEHPLSTSSPGQPSTTSHSIAFHPARYFVFTHKTSRIASNFGKVNPSRASYLPHDEPKTNSNASKD
jgi:hypothetical protein